MNNPSTLNYQLSTPPARHDRRLTARRFVWWTLAIIIGAIFIYAGAIKALDSVGFARDIDNYKLLPWPVAVALGLYLPWLEILSGLALVTRRLYRGGLLILTLLTTVFITASIMAKARGLDISCGCFGHVSKGWGFGWHLLLDLGILGSLIGLVLSQERRPKKLTSLLRLRP